MSHSFLEFADFDGAWRYSSTPSIATAQIRPIAFAGKPTLIHIRAPTSRSLTASQASTSSIFSRRRTQSDTTLSFLLPAPLFATAGAERPVSAILVSFAPIHWTDSAPHPGEPADIPRGEDVEAVSPKSALPGALQRVLMRNETGESVRFVEPLRPTKKMGTSVEAIKSPYPRREIKGWRKVRRWCGRAWERLRR